jgi:hypothetical protein
MYEDTNYQQGWGWAPRPTTLSEVQNVLPSEMRRELDATVGNLVNTKVRERLGGDGDLSLRTDTVRGTNVALGWADTLPLADDAKFSQNLFVGRLAGTGLTGGSNNVIVGRYSGVGTLSGSLILHNGVGGIRWLDSYANAIQSVGTADTPLTEDNTMSMTYNQFVSQ